MLRGAARQTERARGDVGHIGERPQRCNKLRLPCKLSLFTSDLPLMICREGTKATNTRCLFPCGACSDPADVKDHMPEEESRTVPATNTVTRSASSTAG